MWWILLKGTLIPLPRVATQINLQVTNLYRIKEMEANLQQSYSESRNKSRHSKHTLILYIHLPNLYCLIYGCTLLVISALYFLSGLNFTFLDFEFFYGFGFLSV
jgi:hypothetical protein